MHLQQTVDLCGVGAGAGGDALLAAVLEDVGVRALLARHRRDDGELAAEHLVVEAGGGHLVLHAAHAGHHAHDAAHAAHLLHLAQLVGEIVQVELAGLHLPGDRSGLFRVDRLGGLFDQADDVAHAEDAVGDAAREEFLQRVHLLAGADQLDRLAGDGTHGERRAAAAVAVHAGEHEAGDADALVEALGEVHGVLAGQRIGDQQDLVRVGDLADIRHLHHQRLVDMGAAGGVEDDDVVAAELRRLHGALGDLHRRLAGDDGQGRHVHLLADLAQLLLGGGPARVERGHQDLLALPARHAHGDLAGGGGLAGALQADHHDDDGRRRVQVDGDAFLAQHGDEFVMDDLDHHLAGLDRLQHLGADGLFADLVGEFLDDLERDVGFQQRTAHLAHRRGDILLRQRATASEAAEDRTEPFLKAFKHRHSFRFRVSRKIVIRAANCKPQSTNAPGGASRCRVLASGICLYLQGPGRPLGDKSRRGTGGQ